MSAPAWQRVGCRHCDQVFQIDATDTPGSGPGLPLAPTRGQALRQIPCGFCGQVGHLIVLPFPGTRPSDGDAAADPDAAAGEEGGG